MTLRASEKSAADSATIWLKGNRVPAGIKLPDTTLVLEAIDLARSSLEPYLFNHVMRSWLFSILLSDGVEFAPDPELLAVSAVLHDLGLTDRYTAQNRFEEIVITNVYAVFR